MVRLKCFECTELFNNKKDITEHLKWKHHVENNGHKYKCIIFDDETNAALCTKQFSSLEALFLHVDLCLLHYRKLEGIDLNT